MDTQTPILDWRGYGDLGQQNEMENTPPSVLDGALSAHLKPNSISGASWELPAGVTLTDMVIEALRPADPMVSYSSVNIEIHASAVNPHDGRLYILHDADINLMAARKKKPYVVFETGKMEST